MARPLPLQGRSANVVCRKGRVMQAEKALEGRHALITGGGTGIGAAAAAHLHAAGAKVSLLGRRLEPLQQAAERFGGHSRPCAVPEPDQIKRAFDEARSVNGPIEMLIVNAG